MDISVYTMCQNSIIMTLLRSVYDEDLIELTDELSLNENNQDIDIDEKFKLTKKRMKKSLTLVINWK